jgi:hypothetical protein
MSAVTAVHKEVHHDTSKKQQDQKPIAGKDMNAMFEAKQQSRDYQR